MGKHAYLVMAHHEFRVLKKLIMLLDDPRNDIYVHVDKKAKEFNPNYFSNLSKHSTLNFIKRTDVTWGGYSQINCELSLLIEAAKTYHDYYHLLSGVDLPIKRQDQIHTFFDRHPGQEFLYIQQGAMGQSSFISRIRFYHFFQEMIGRKRGSAPLVLLNRMLIKIQEVIGVYRHKHMNYQYQKGTTWFSITHNLANYVIVNEPAINKLYRFTKCADEIFLHSLAWNSEFKEKIIGNSYRFIDWKRGRPYTFRETDFDLLVSSDAFWARKFSEKMDPIIIDNIFDHLT